MLALEKALSALQDITKMMREEYLDDRKAVELVINRLDKDIIMSFYYGHCPEFDELCQTDEDMWDVIEDAADYLEQKL
jgi:hypothetical protein